MKYLIFSIVLLFIFFLNFTNVYYESFTDEYDNLYGGSLINRGILPYSGFFSNHAPVAYFTAAFIEIWTGTNFFMFRVIYQYLIWMMEVLLLYYIWKRYSIRPAVIVALFFAAAAVSLNYFSGHLLVADNVAGIFLTGAYILTLYSIVYKKRINGKMLLVVSLILALALFTALTYLFAVFFISIFALLLSFENDFRKTGLVKKLIILLIPYLIVGLYLLLTHSFQDMFFQTVTFNKRYYVYGEAAQAKNLIELGYFLLLKFGKSFGHFASSLSTYSLSDPVVPSLFLFNIALWTYFVVTKKIKALLLAY